MIKAEEIMKFYSLSYDYFNNFLNESILLISDNFEQPILLLSAFVMLISVLLLSRKVRILEKAQLNDIDDITSYNCLINEELGILKKEQDEFNQVIKNSENNAQSIGESSNEGKLFNNAPYTQAVQLARRGYAREDIISLCSLTESEAELILALHSNSKAA